MKKTAQRKELTLFRDADLQQVVGGQESGTTTRVISVSRNVAM